MPGALDAGQLVDDRYALEERIGEDALGTIWRAHDRGLGRAIVLRAVHFPGDVFRDDPRRRQAALTAGRQAIRVDHPRAVHVYDAFLDGDGLVMVTEIAEGRALGSLVERKPLSAKRAAAIGLDVLEAIEAAHAIGVVHGSVSPAVVLVGDRDRARLAGFGLAPSFQDASSTTWIEAAGTPSCIAPEQANLHGSAKASDLWALGATLYFAVEGVPAFAGASPVATLVHVTHDPPRPPEKAGELAPVLERLLSRDPADRPSVEVVRAVLTEIGGVARVEEAAAAAAPPPKRRVRKERVRPAPETERETEPEALTPERDWSAAIGTDEAWVEWAPEGPLDASDVWLPDGEGFEAGTEDVAATTATDAVAPATDPASLAMAAAPAPMVARPIPPAGVSEGEDEEPRRYRSTPSWPPPPKRRIGVTILCTMIATVMLLLLVTEGRIGRSTSTRTTLSAQQRPVLASDPSSVPSDWITYRHPSVDFGLAYPPGWVLREEGPVITIRDPASGAELRVDYRRPPGPDPQRAWEDLEGSFSAQHPNDYRRLQLSPASFLGDVAALWEFTFAENNVLVHAVDVGFHTKKYAFALYFQAPANNWSNLLPTFHSFLGSVRAPK